MAKYRVLIKPSAAKELESTPKRDRLRIVERIQALSDNPRPSRCEKLSGQEKYRIRHGRYRVLYAVDGQKLTVLIVKVGHRRGVYR